jgi:RNA polymerase sigma factor (sigma-70 family)
LQVEYRQRGMSDQEDSSRQVDRSDEQLMTAYVAGDESAFGQLFARYAPLLARIARGMVFSDDESRDIVQQAFLQLHRARRDYRADQPLRPWLLTIAYNLCRDRWRTVRHRQEVPLEHAPPQVDRATPAEVLEQRRRANSLHSALAKLSHDQRQVVELHWLAGVPLPEVAAALGISLSAAKVRAHRAYQHLRASLGREV